MTSTLPPADENGEPVSVLAGRGAHLKRVRGSALAWAILGAIVGALGLLFVTGLSHTPWLFLLYPALIALLIVSLGVIVLHLLQRF